MAAAALVAFMTQGHLRLSVQLVTVWNAFSIAVLALVWTRILSAKPRESLKTAKLQDSSQKTIFAFVVMAACISIFAVGYLLRHGRNEERLLGMIVLAFGTLLGSWFLVHTLFALHYAHIFYGDDPNTQGYRGGLEFPGDAMPDYLDFAYFSFVVGMTCQVSDVQVCSRRLRRLTLVHGMLSFVFNTVILALSINVVSGLFGK